MSEELDALILDLLGTLAAGPRPYDEFLDAWRTSCPRLPVWEEANDRGFVRRGHLEGQPATVAITPEGLDFLRRHRESSNSSRKP